MSGDKEPCDGVCVFHENYEHKLDIVYDWHLGSKEREVTMQKSIDNMTIWFRRLVITIFSGVVLQVVMFIIKHELT